jgi:hypothetical protein
MKKIVEYIMWPIKKFIEQRKYKKRIKQLKKRDPFIYK